MIKGGVSRIDHHLETRILLPGCEALSKELCSAKPRFLPLHDAHEAEHDDASEDS